MFPVKYFGNLGHWLLMCSALAKAAYLHFIDLNVILPLDRPRCSFVMSSCSLLGTFAGWKWLPALSCASVCPSLCKGWQHKAHFHIGDFCRRNLVKILQNKTSSLMFIFSNPDYFRNWSRVCFLWGSGWGVWHSIENWARYIANLAYRSLRYINCPPSRLVHRDDDRM